MKYECLIKNCIGHWQGRVYFHNCLRIDCTIRFWFVSPICEKWSLSRMSSFPPFAHCNLSRRFFKVCPSCVDDAKQTQMFNGVRIDMEKPASIYKGKLNDIKCALFVSVGTIQYDFKTFYRPLELQHLNQSKSLLGLLLFTGTLLLLIKKKKSLELCALQCRRGDSLMAHRMPTLYLLKLFCDTCLVFLFFCFECRDEIFFSFCLQVWGCCKALSHWKKYGGKVGFTFTRVFHFSIWFQHETS